MSTTNGTNSNQGRALRHVQKFFPQVRTLRDATTPTLIDVTAADCKSSKRKAHRECAMAVACRRAMKLDGVIISRATAVLVKGTKATRYILSSTVKAEITSFDRGGQFEPGTYRLSTPHSSQKIGQHKKFVPPTNPGKLGPRNMPRHLTTGIRSILA